jgi:hypothetical protein
LPHAHAGLRWRPVFKIKHKSQGRNIMLWDFLCIFVGAKQIISTKNKLLKTTKANYEDDEKVCNDIDAGLLSTAGCGRKLSLS